MGLSALCSTWYSRMRSRNPTHAWKPMGWKATARGSSCMNVCDSTQRPEAWSHTRTALSWTPHVMTSDRCEHTSSEATPPSWELSVASRRKRFPPAAAAAAPSANMPRVCAAKAARAPGPNPESPSRTASSGAHATRRLHSRTSVEPPKGLRRHATSRPAHGAAASE